MGTPAASRARAGPWQRWGRTRAITRRESFQAALLDQTNGQVLVEVLDPEE
ncbi:MAG TPA: hypothetical protein VF794_19550 [Archangium sp.]|uniref:hypothetical protein n=1 Tax=Archangium sp. TaxID=1872627 RepID=UPI002ED84096